MDEYLAKPFTRHDLTMALGEWLRPSEGTTAVTEASPPPAPAMPPEKAMPSVLDRAKLDALHRAMGEDFVELIPAYLGDASAILEKLPLALEGEDAKEVRRLAHSLKSTSANVGALALSEQAGELEAEAKDGDLSAAMRRIESLATLFERVREALEGVENGS